MGVSKASGVGSPPERKATTGGLKGSGKVSPPRHSNGPTSGGGGGGGVGGGGGAEILL